MDWILYTGCICQTDTLAENTHKHTHTSMYTRENNNQSNETGLKPLVWRTPTHALPRRALYLPSPLCVVCKCCVCFFNLTSVVCHRAQQAEEAVKYSHVPYFQSVSTVKTFDVKKRRGARARSFLVFAPRNANATLSTRSPALHKCFIKSGTLGFGEHLVVWCIRTVKKTFTDEIFNPDSSWRQNVVRSQVGGFSFWNFRSNKMEHSWI